MGISSANLVDVSFAGAIVSIGGRMITAFADDANPVDFQEVEVANFDIDLNGEAIRTIKPHPILMSVTVIAGTSDDNYLFDIWSKCQARNMAMSNRKLEGFLSKDKMSLTFSDGTIISGPGGYSADVKGKVKSRTYTFAFLKVL